MRILIIKLAATGDVLRTTSVLEGLREKYPSAEIDWLTSQTAKKLFVNNPYVDRVYAWEKRPERAPFDLVIGLEDEFDVCKLASEIGKKVLGAYVVGGEIAYTPSAWFDMSAISKFGLDKANRLKKQNRKTFQQHMADLLNIKVGPYVFSLAPEEIEYGKKYVRGLGISKQDRVVGINTGAGSRWPLKSLSIEKTVKLVKMLEKRLGLVSIILGGEDERGRNEVICRETGMPNGGVHSLRNFAGIVNQSRLLVSSDSLAMHLAIALKKKLVVFFGPTSPAEIELYGLGTKVYSKMDCLVCYKKKCDIKPNCMELLSIDEIFEAVKREMR